MTPNNFPSQGRRCSCGFLLQCLVEAVCILDCVCVEDPSLVYRTFPCIKALFGRLSSDLSFARVLLPIAQFYLNHGNARVQTYTWEGCGKLHLIFFSFSFLRNSHCAGEMAAVDCDVVWKLVFGRFPAELFNDPFLAHELLRFLRLNLESLQRGVPDYTHFFPNLLKVREDAREMRLFPHTRGHHALRKLHINKKA